MKTVVGLFEYYQDAERAVNELNNRGFGKTDISVAARDRALQDQVIGSKEQAVAESAGAGAIGGTAVGGIAGLLVGIGALTIPGIGPVLAAGPLAAAIGSTLAGAGIGAAAGGLIGALVGLGIPEEDAHFYAEGVKRGGVLVTVRTSDDRAHEALRILRDANATDVNARRDEWTKAGWNRFDDQITPDDTYPTFSGRPRTY
jgi:heat induced stress protein YflT